jgi:hypothetical protein
MAYRTMTTYQSGDKERREEIVCQITALEAELAEINSRAVQDSPEFGDYAPKQPTEPSRYPFKGPLNPQS